MINFEWIRKTFGPPIVATVIAISLVSSWGSQEIPADAGISDASTVTASQYQQVGLYINEMCHSTTEPADASIVLLVYRLPLLSEERGRYVSAMFHQQAGVAANYIAFTNAECHQAMKSSRTFTTWQM